MNEYEKITNFLRYLDTRELYFKDDGDILEIDVWMYREKDDSVIFCRLSRCRF